MLKFGPSGRMKNSAQHNALDLKTKRELSQEQKDTKSRDKTKIIFKLHDQYINVYFSEKIFNKLSVLNFAFLSYQSKIALGYNKNFSPEMFFNFQLEEKSYRQNL